MEQVFLESFGTVIVDEVHLVMARKTFRSLLYVTPRYLIVLSEHLQIRWFRCFISYLALEKKK